MSHKQCHENKSDFNSLLALLLIVLQFGKSSKEKDKDKDQLLDDSLLFLVALYFVLCGCCGLKRGC